MTHSLLQYDPNAPLDLRVEWEERLDGVHLLGMSIHSHFLETFPLRIRFLLALPEGAGPFPALLHLHGGAQCADPQVALAWARQGYAALCPDWSGPAGHENPRHPTQWPDGFPRIHDFTPDPAHAAVRHIVLGVRRCIDFLCGHERVNPSRIGMCGISWGGFMTWLVNGVDPRLRCAVPVFGCGLADDRPATPAWRGAFQPERFADTQHAPVFHVNGTHDFFGRLDTAESLLTRLSVPHRRLYVPNEDHGLSPAARESVHAWFRAHLHDDGDIPPEPDIADPDGVRHHAATSSRRSVFRKWPSPELPTFGTHFLTRSYPGGFHFSSPVQRLDDDNHPPDHTLYDPERDGLEPLFLRWEYDNLRVHLPETARLVPAAPDGVRLEPESESMTLFIRVDTPPPHGTRAIQLRIAAPVPCLVALHAFTGSEVEEASRHSHPAVRSPPGGGIDLTFPLSQFTGPMKTRAGDLHMFKLSLRAEPPAPADFRLLRLLWTEDQPDTPSLSPPNTST